MLTKDLDAPTYSNMEPRAIVPTIARFTARHVVLTGGEPAMHNLRDLTTELVERDFTVQIETSGTYQLFAHAASWVTLSPKFNMAGGKELQKSLVKRANEIKMPVGKQADIDRLLHLLDSGECCDEVWLQPISQNAKATDLCLKAASQNGWKVSLQAHKYAGLR